uniref:Uncharacterized protein n=1 Tax=Trypanosoma vivax (strain Y486) TaxID=1055687 RepID=G0TZ60_TRYVY|nr:conserved hypothetical protein [Trypanosoma vivax Y486]
MLQNVSQTSEPNGPHVPVPAWAHSIGSDCELDTIFDDDGCICTETCSISTEATFKLKANDSGDEAEEEGAAHNSQCGKCASHVIFPEHSTIPSTRTSSCVISLVQGAPLTQCHESNITRVDASTPEWATELFPKMAVLWEVIVNPLAAIERNASGKAELLCQWHHVVPNLEATGLSEAGPFTAPKKVVCVLKIGRKDIPKSLRGEPAEPQQQQRTCYYRAVSRDHCEVRLHFSLQGRIVNDPSGNGMSSEPFYKLNSFDITNNSSSNCTYYNTVPLFPLHRYHFPVTRDANAHKVELCLGRYYNCTINIGSETLHQIFTGPTVATIAAVSGYGANKPNTEHSGLQKHSDAAVQCVLPLRPGRSRNTSKTTTPVQPKAPAAAKRRSTAKGAARSKREPVKKIRARSRVKSRPLPTLTTPGVSDSNTKESLTIVTTGIRLTTYNLRKLRSVNLVINPPPSEYKRATHLVISGPLMRSVKLLTAIPFVKYIVDQAWLNAILMHISAPLAVKALTACRPAVQDINPAVYTYAEARTAASIESVNDFSLEALMSTSPAQRQSLFDGLTFYVHPAAKPQESGGNDLRYVILASGGTLTQNAAEASVAVMPRTDMGSKPGDWGNARDCPSEPPVHLYCPK